MKGIYKKLIIVSLVMAVIAGATVFMYLRSLQSSHQADKDTTTILVATETISPRTLIDEKMIKKVEVADEEIFNGYINDASSIIGKYAKGIILKDEGFHEEKLMAQKDVELSLRLEPSHRAVSIKIPDSGGVSHLIQPGDFVDILIFLPEKEEQSAPSRPDLSKLILQNIEILAIDKELNYEAESEVKEVPTNFLITLSVPTGEVEKLYLAESIGNIKFALRPFNNHETIETDIKVWENIIANRSTSENKAKDNYNKYTVKVGDTLRSISRKFYGGSERYKDIKELNQIKNENLIVPGQVIKLPAVN